MTPSFIDVARQQSVQFGLINPDDTCVTNIVATAKQVNDPMAYEGTKLTVIDSSATDVTFRADFPTLSAQKVTVVKVDNAWRVDSSENLN